MDRLSVVCITSSTKVNLPKSNFIQMLWNLPGVLLLEGVLKCVFYQPYLREDPNQYFVCSHFPIFILRTYEKKQYAIFT